LELLQQLEQLAPGLSKQFLDLELGRSSAGGKLNAKLEKLSTQRLHSLAQLDFPVGMGTHSLERSHRREEQGLLGCNGFGSFFLHGKDLGIQVSDLPLANGHQVGKQALFELSATNGQGIQLHPSRIRGAFSIYLLIDERHLPDNSA